MLELSYYEGYVGICGDYVTNVGMRPVMSVSWGGSVSNVGDMWLMITYVKLQSWNKKPQKQNKKQVRKCEKIRLDKNE